MHFAVSCQNKRELEMGILLRGAGHNDCNQNPAQKANTLRAVLSFYLPDLVFASDLYRILC